MANIIDVAKLAGVSKSTVSRVISNNGYVKEETRLAIEAAMKTLDYSPSYFAQGIRTGKTKTIAMFVPDYSNLFYNAMLESVENEALKHGYMVLLCNTGSSQINDSREIRYTKELLNRKIDGIIYNTYEKNKNLEYFLKLAKKTPLVFMDKVVPKGNDAPYVISDGYNSSKAAVKYLYSLGCKKIAYLRIPPKISVINHRFEGYMRGLEECGLPQDSRYVYQSSGVPFTQDYSSQVKKSTLLNPHLLAGMDGAKYLLSLAVKPDAIMASTDVMAIGALNQLKALGVKIPDEIKVIGFDNIALCSLVDPPLTTIAQPIHSIGAIATRILINRINGTNLEKEQLILDDELIIREST